MGGMDRLTKRTEYNCACWNGNQEHTIRKRYLTLLEALAQYEDIGLTPDEIAALRAENANLRDQLDHAGLVLDAYKKDIAALHTEVERLRAERWEETASDNTGYQLTYSHEIYAVSDPDGHVICEFLRETGEAASAALEGEA